VPFQKRFEAVIEKYHPNNWPLLYACTAYWYQAAGESDLYQPVSAAQRVDYYVSPSPKVKSSVGESQTFSKKQQDGRATP
jgi:hypothetical protein